MNVTLDTSAIIAVITNEPTKTRLVDLTTGTSLCSPRSIHWEIGNAFSAMLKRQRMTLNQAQACIKAYQGLPITLIDVDLERTMALIGQLNIYAYDAYLIECARQTGTPLLTLDKGLINAAKLTGIQIMEV